MITKFLPTDVVSFAKNVKKGMYVHDSEYGINKGWSFINKVEFELTKLKLGMKFDSIKLGIGLDEDDGDYSLISESQKRRIFERLITYYETDSKPSIERIEIKNNIFSSNIEFGLKKNIFNSNGNTVSLYSTVAPIPLISGDLVKDKKFIKFGISYGRNWSIFNLHNNYIEFNASNKTYFQQKKNQRAILSV